MTHRNARSSGRGITWASALLLALGAGCGEDAAPRQQTPAATTPAAGQAFDRVLIGAEFQLVSRGVRYATVRADSMFVNEDSSAARIFGLRVQLVDTLGNRVAELQSSTGRYNLRTQQLVAVGTAALVGPGSGRVESPVFTLDPATHRIWSDSSTRVQWAGGGTTTFSTFSVDDRFRKPQGTGARGPQRGSL